MWVFLILRNLERREYSNRVAEDFLSLLILEIAELVNELSVKIAGACLDIMLFDNSLFLQGFHVPVEPILAHADISYELADAGVAFPVLIAVCSKNRID